MEIINSLRSIKINMLNILVSVIVPVYNVEKYIHEAVNSIINQTHKDLEIILVDDGSPDNCGKICDDYAAIDTRINVIHKTNGGVSSARNEGIKAANGEWIYFVDPDDWIEPNTIEKALIFTVQNECDMCMFDFELVYRNKKVNQSALAYNGDVFLDLNNDDLFLAYICMTGSVCNIITKKNIIKQIRFDEGFPCGEDGLFKLQLYSRIKSFCYMRDVLYHYRMRLGSAVHSVSLNKDIDSREMFYETNVKIIHGVGYPDGAARAVHSKYLGEFWYVCGTIFDKEIPLKEKKLLYRKYVNSKVFKESIQDFSSLYFERINAICLKNKRAPSWLFIRFLVAIRNIRNIIKKKEELF